MNGLENIDIASELSADELLSLLKSVFNPNSLTLLFVSIAVIAVLIVLINLKGKGGFGLGYIGFGALAAGGLLFGFTKLIEILPKVMTLPEAYETVFSSIVEEALGGFRLFCEIFIAAGAGLILIAIVIRIVRASKKKSSMKKDNSDTLSTQESVIL